MRLFPRLTAAALVALAVTAGPLACSEAQGKPPDAEDAQGWKEVDALVQDQKLAEALARTERLLAAAQEGRRDVEWARALVRRAQLRIALGGFETAVEELAAAPWPESPRAATAVRLYLARALGEYQNAYAWEIGQRERVASGEKLDLKLWTREQIAAEARRLLAEVFADREALGEIPVGDFEFLEPNDYPKGIRPTLRDAVSYLFAEELADSSRWSPAEHEAWRLDRARLIAGAGEVTETALADPAVHPLARAAAVLGDLERWHRGRKERGAELEAKLVRLERLAQAMDDPEDRAAFRRELERTLPAFRDDPWWAKGQAQLADLVRSEERDAEALIQARAIAAAGEEAHPESYGGKRCRRIREEIEAPQFELAAMRADAAERRSLLVTHANLDRLHLRAYAIDLADSLARAEFRSLVPSGEREIAALLAREQPVASWGLDLSPTPDYRAHRTYAVPPLAAKGVYVIVASARSDFARGGNRLQAVPFAVSDLVLLAEPGRPTDVRAVAGGTGSPLAGVELVLYHHDWRSAPRRTKTLVTGEDGLARVELADDGRGGRDFVVARRGADVAWFELDRWWGWNRSVSEAGGRRALVFTDRSLYRPGQKVLWKALVFSGRAAEGRLALAPRADVTVALLDPNGERVASTTTAANAFGSASGEFVVPAGRLLGNWSLQADPQGSASIGVEEYKRPTFEVELVAPGEELRLGAPAKVAGTARYYFGLPVASGRVAWRVERVVERPLWGRRAWFYWFPIDERPRVVASGTSTLDADGRFTLEFTPEADPRDKAAKPTYSYRIAADVTDDGGETRSGERRLRVGWVAVEARIEGAADFRVAGSKVDLEVLRLDLDGTPRPGEGRYRLFALANPKSAPLPADLPEPPPAEEAERFATPGDRLRPRWASSAELAEVLATFDEGRERSGGSVRHDARGRATIPLGDLPPGAYRLRYETKDRFGETFELATDFVVAGERTAVAVPLAVRLADASVAPGGTARVWIHSGRPGQPVYVEQVRGETILHRWTLVAGEDAAWIDLPIAAKDRGGFAIRAALVADHQIVTDTATLAVPWEDKRLEVAFETFRDKLRPGSRERFTVVVKDAKGRPVEAGAAEVLASMYDRSLDALRPFSVPLAASLYPAFGLGRALQATLGAASPVWQHEEDWREMSEVPVLQEDRFVRIDPYGIGGPGGRFGGPLMARGEMAVAKAPAPAAQAADAAAGEIAVTGEAPTIETGLGRAVETAPAPVELRENFAETAFWEPHLLTRADGSVAIEFEVPDSVTSWKVWAAAATRELATGYAEKTTESVKELMIRPYLPRFLREGDRAELKVVVQNAGDEPFRGEATLALFDPETHEDLTGAFGLAAADLRRPFAVEPGKGADLTFSLATPSRLGPIAVRVEARAGAFTDGELRPLPILPARVRLAQSRFATLSGKDRRELTFADLAAPDPTRIHEQMVVTVDGQLFYSMLDALPYLVDYPYECTEQTLNRFVSTGILGSLYAQYPAVGTMAGKLATRETEFERFDAPDPNRRLALEETPWLAISRGGERESSELLRVLDPRVVTAQRTAALAKLREAQLPSGAFPWFPGGPPSPWMTLYLLYGFGKAAEFGVEVPEDMVRSGWRYLAEEARQDWIRKAMADDCCWEPLTFLSYVASTYPDADWLGEFFPAAERKKVLDFVFSHWREHSPLLKLMLSMTLERADRHADAEKVLASVMDSAKTTRDEGTFWAPEDRAWLWYNDTIETHAWAIRALLEVAPEDARLPGLVQWLFVNKKLNHWKSTRATAEVLYSLAKYLAATGQLAVREAITVEVADQKTTFEFSPDEFTGKKNQVIVPGAKLGPDDATVVAEKATPGLAFVSATWHFSTEQIPEEARGDLFRVERRYFRRERKGEETVLVPLAEGARIAVGDELEVQLSIAARSPAEYVHLRDPRPAGFEPVSVASGWRWQTGIAAYEEIRDSGSNFFFEWLPQGEYTLKHRLRAATAGVFRAHPAELQSMYAPEFNAYSTGARIAIAAGE